VDECDHLAVSSDAYAALAGLGLAILFPVVVLLAYSAWYVVQEMRGRWRG
jgi:hypothetical protein